VHGVPGPDTRCGERSDDVCVEGGPSKPGPCKGGLRGGVGAHGYGLGAMGFSDWTIFVFFMLDGGADEG
jgi:hypothetical protein